MRVAKEVVCRTRLLMHRDYQAGERIANLYFQPLTKAQATTSAPLFPFRDGSVPRPEFCQSEEGARTDRQLDSKPRRSRREDSAKLEISTGLHPLQWRREKLTLFASMKRRNSQWRIALAYRLHSNRSTVLPGVGWFGRDGAKTGILGSLWGLASGSPVFFAATVCPTDL